ncbi:MAG TPA: hypothetical protein VG797_07030 [Phycisphaerales bacterium]|nr:hypothetical protein [Phycisphaerales bacterium]
MRHSLSFPLCGLVMSAFPILTGCASTNAGAKPGAESMTLLAEQPATSPLPPDVELAPLKQSNTAERRLFIQEGKNAGATIIETWKKEGDRYTLSRRLESSNEPIEEHTFALDKQKGLVVESSIDYVHGVKVEFSPKLVAAPAAGLAPGIAFKQSPAIRLPTIKNPSKIRERGTSVREVTYLGDQTVRFRGVTWEAHHCREVVTNDLKSAKATRTTDRWIVDGVGLVAERYEEKVTALGLPIESTVRALVLLPEGK